MYEAYLSPSAVHATSGLAPANDTVTRPERMKFHGRRTASPSHCSVTSPPNDNEFVAGLPRRAWSTSIVTSSSRDSPGASVNSAGVKAMAIAFEVPVAVARIVRAVVPSLRTLTRRVAFHVAAV